MAWLTGYLDVEAEEGEEVDDAYAPEEEVARVAHRHHGDEVCLAIC